MAKCRSCKQDIEWVRTQAGKSMPIDPKPRDDGTLVLTIDDGPLTALGLAAAREMVFNGLREVNMERRFVSHFSTCPFAQQHRRK